MSGDKVFVTGASGHLGFRVLLHALQQGYEVRAAVRSKVKADLIVSNPALKALNKSDRLSFVVVPDFLTPGAFDEHVQDVKYIIHVASPLASQDPPDGDYNAYFIAPAVQGTLGILESAKRSETVERVVVTSSIIAIYGFEAGSGKDIVWTAETRQPLDEGPYTNSMHAYAASKIAALNHAEGWIKSEKPQFDTIHIHPGFIFGRDELCDSTDYFQTGTNRILLNIALGNATKNLTLTVSYAHVNDVARAHVMSLEPKVLGDQSFILSNPGHNGETWDDVLSIVEKHYPEEVRSGVFNPNNAWSARGFKADVQKTEETFGFKHATLEESVKSVLDHYLELVQKEQLSRKVNGA